MDSGDEASASSGEEVSEKAAVPAPKEVETLGQMLRLSESLIGRANDLPPSELVDICQAAARVKFYDPSLFKDTLGPALIRRFRNGLSSDSSDKRLSIDGVIEVLSTLTSLNAASALSQVFESAADALKDHGGFTTSQRKLITDVYASASREKDVAFLQQLPPQGLVHNEVKGSQKAGITSEGLPMRPGVRICETYFKTGNCRSGSSCRWDHPEALRVTFNSEGYPVRPWAPVCPYYTAMGTCDYRKTCKWHHQDKRERRATSSCMAFAWIPKGGMG